MTRTATARRLATGAAYGGGSVGLAGAALFALLREEARAARRKVEARTTKQDPPSGDGIYGRGKGKPLVFTVLGDSSAVGLGVERATETPGVLIAAALTELAERPVRLVRLAVSGAVSRDLDDAGRQGAGRAPRRRADHDRRQRRHQPDAARGVGAAPRRRRPPARPRPAARSSSAPAPTSARSGRSPSRCARFARRWSREHGRRADRRRRRGRRPHRVAGLGPRPGVRLRPQHVQHRRVPPQRRRLRPGRRRPAAVGRRRRRGLAGHGRPRRAARSAAAPCARSRGPPRGRPAGPAPRSSRPRCAARTPARAGPGRCCAAAGRPTSPRRRRRRRRRRPPPSAEAGAAVVPGVTAE